MEPSEQDIEKVIQMAELETMMDADWFTREHPALQQAYRTISERFGPTGSIPPQDPTPRDNT
jgi:hypothetical protein